MDRIRSVAFEFPNLTEKDERVNRALFDLFSEFSNFEKISEDSLESTTSRRGLWPQIIIRKAYVEFPRIIFFPGAQTRDWRLGNLSFGFNSPEAKKDPHGEKRVERKLLQYEYALLEVEELFQKLSGSFSELNHIGVDFGPGILPKSEYQEIKKLIAKSTNLYRYPEEEEWPFIIPSSDDEFEGEIIEMDKDRNPKLELVYSDDYSQPVVQLDIQTKLSRKELTDLIPEPFGFSFDKTGDYFRSVFVDTDWEAAVLRLDLRYQSAAEAAGKDLGYFLIEKGGRIYE